MKKTIVKIDLLMLSCDNPRLDPTLSEDESIFNMVKDQNEKLFELASDIVDYGLNPLDTVGVYPSELFPGYYEVGEGNRRLCALKLLRNPTRIQHINTNLFSKFKTLSENFSSPDSIEVAIFDDEKAMRHWMEIRHMGEQSGKGLSKWNSVQKARFNRMQTGSDSLLDFWDWMIAQNILSNEEIARVTKTNWQRILREKYFPFLKIQNDGKYSVLPEDIDAFSERIKAVQQELDGQTVAIVYDQTQIDKFFNLISNKLYSKTYQEIIIEESKQIEFVAIENEPPKDIEHLEIVDNFHENETTDNISQSAHNNQNIDRDVFNGCATVIPYAYSIRSGNMRLNKIINELKRINADEYPNACGTLLRTLFELSAKVYLEKQDGKDHTETEFAPAIIQTANQLRQKGCINNSQHSAIKKDVDDLRKIFNGYMHNPESYPSSESLKNFFKCHRVFIQECLK